MAKITRQTQKIFAGSASSNGQFGSAKVGTKVLTNSVTTLQALAAYAGGWLDALITPQSLPAYEEEQALHYINTYQLCYMFQEGISEYDAGTTYFQNSIVKAAGTFEIYGSLTDNNTGNPLTDTTNWTYLRNLQADIAISMGFEASPAGRKVICNGFSVAKTSGATFAGAQYERMYTYWWTNVSQTYAIVSGGRGASAAADFAANKVLHTPDFSSASPMQVGAIVASAGQNNIGSATVASTGNITLSGSTSGHAITAAESAQLAYSVALSSASPGPTTFIGGGASPVSPVGTDTTQITTNAGGQAHSHSLSAGSASYSGDATSVIQPVFGIYYYINY